MKVFLASRKLTVPVLISAPLPPGPILGQLCMAEMGGVMGVSMNIYL